MGLSLHSQFSGCSDIYLALDDREEPESDHEKHVARLLHVYLETLVEEGGFDRDTLTKGLTAAAFAGVLRYICSFSAYRIDDESTRKAIRNNVWNLLDDLMDLVQFLAIDSEDEDLILEIAYTLHSNDDSERAYDFYEGADLKPRLPSKIDTAIKEAAPPDIFPTLEITDDERATGKLGNDRRNVGIELFKHYGALLIKDAFSPDLIKECYEAFTEKSEEHRKSIQKNKALQVGDHRFMITVDFDGPFAHQKIYAPPLVLPILKRLLSEDLILGSYTAVASMPGAADQKMHRDNLALFGKRPDLKLPHFSIAMIVPLIPLNEETGATRIIKGSHRPGSRDGDDPLPHQEPLVDPGSCYLMDCRLYHQGMANRSERIRPILSLVYQRPWYRDMVNFKQQKSLSISKDTASALPKDCANLVSWAC